MNLIRVDTSEFTDRDCDFDSLEARVKCIAHNGLDPVKGPWICGGAVRRAITGLDESDYDFFFPGEHELTSFVADLMKRGFTMSSSGKMNVTLTGDIEVGTEDKPKKHKVIVQAIKIYAPSASIVLDSFDFTICQFAMDGGDGILLNPMALFDLTRKKLVVHKDSHTSLH